MQIDAFMPPLFATLISEPMHYLENNKNKAENLKSFKIRKNINPEKGWQALLETPL